MGFDKVMGPMGFTIPRGVARMAPHSSCRGALIPNAASPSHETWRELGWFCNFCTQANRECLDWCLLGTRGKHINCEATDEWKTNESATVGASLEDTGMWLKPLQRGVLGIGFP